MKKTIIFFCMILFLAFSAVSVSAEEVTDFNGASDAFAQALRAGKNFVSLDGYNISKDDIGFLIQYSQAENADVFWYPQSVECSYSKDSDWIRELSWENAFDDFSEIEQMQKEFEKYAAEAINVCFCEGMSDLEKIISAHDYLTETASYAVADDYSFTAYSIFVRQEGVCQGYAYAFKYLMNHAGIECHYVTSNALNHGWNIVKLDGEYYNVDVTADDAEATYNGAVIKHGRERHSKLLCSDMAFESGADDIQIWSTELLPECKSTKYDNAFFKEVSGTMEYIDGKWYYVEPNKYINGSRKVMVTDFEQTKVFLETKEPVFSVASHGEKLYIAVGNIVYEAETNGEYKEFCSTVGEIFGCNIHLDKLYYGVYRNKNYSVCNKILSKNLDCVEGVSLTLSPYSYTMDFRVKAFLELDGAVLIYKFGKIEKQIPLVSLLRDGVLSVPFDCSQIEEDIVITIKSGDEEKVYKISPKEYGEKILFSKKDTKAENVVTCLFAYAGVQGYGGFDVEIDKGEFLLKDENEKISYVGTELKFEDKVILKHRFSTTERCEFVSNGKYSVEIKDGYCDVTIELSSFNMDVSYTVATDGLYLKYSVLSYIERCNDKTAQELLVRYYLYCIALKEYNK